MVSHSPSAKAAMIRANILPMEVERSKPSVVEMMNFPFSSHQSTSSAKCRERRVRRSSFHTAITSNSSTRLVSHGPSWGRLNGFMPPDTSKSSAQPTTVPMTLGPSAQCWTCSRCRSGEVVSSLSTLSLTTPSTRGWLIMPGNLPSVSDKGRNRMTSSPIQRGRRSGSGASRRRRKRTETSGDLRT
jgi:hypothetical protein